MKYKRLFTFGCSFTQFHWPTWADLIAYDLDISYENWGLCGAGNEYIFMSMLKCDSINNLCDTDLILINWSTWAREDRVKSNGNWNCGGNIFFNGAYNKAFLLKYHNYHNDTIKNANWIHAANKIYNIAFQSHMLDYEEKAEITDQMGYKELLDFHSYLNLPPKYVFDYSCNSRFNNQCIDHHPDILCHLEHVKKIYSNLGLEIKAETIDYAHHLQDRITKDIHKLKGWQDLEKIMQEILPDIPRYKHNRR